MSKASEREQILNEYGAWVEQKTLDGLDLSVEAYLEAVKATENAEKIESLEAWAEADDATFLRNARIILGIKQKEEISER